MPKNIVICCDGTGNEIEEKQSNVLKLYRMLKRDNRQLVYYDPGIGTMAASNDWAVLKQKLRNIWGLATGTGLDANILKAYRFLVENYQDGDVLFFFGFSRGAYTVRALAGFMNTIGLMKPEQLHLAPYALTAYKKLKTNERSLETKLFEQALKTDFPQIYFMGLWDTVASVLVPRRDRFLIPSVKHLAFTDENSMVERVSHALAIDEHRRMFRAYHWKAGGKYRSNPYNEASEKDQGIVQTWFVGAHSDIGGGQKEETSGLSKIALNWMIDEAGPGLRVITQTRNQIANGSQRKGSSWDYCEPDPTAPIHPSLKGVWWILEIIPKWVKLREWPKRIAILGLYWPFGEPRFIEPDAQIHSSVRQRQAAVPDYKPRNLPPDDQ